VNAGPQCDRQPNVASDDQNQSTQPADPREIAAQCSAVRMIVMPEYHPGKATR
jgi:hypothetical protein